MANPLTDEYVALDLDLKRLHDLLFSVGEYETRLLRPNADGRAEFSRAAAPIRARLDSLEAPDDVYALLRGHLLDFLSSVTQQAESAFAHPESLPESIAGQVESVFENDTRPDDEKTVRLIEFLSDAKDALDGVRTAADPKALSSGATYALDILTHYSENSERCLPHLSPAQRRELLGSLNVIRARLSDMILPDAPAPSSDASEGDDRRIPLEEDVYRGLLSDRLGVELDELLKWHASEIEKTRAAVFEIASRLPVPEKARTMADVNAILNKYAGPCDSPEAMFERMRGYLDRAREAAKQYVRFPDERCRLTEVPYSVRHSFPWGGYMGGDGRLRPITGRVFLNNYNYRAVTDGWMKMQAIHECYPGHHIQYVRRTADPLPETMRIGAKHIPLIEGTAHRSEHVFEFVFEEDPFYPLFVAYRRHHTAVRIKSDLMLRYFGRPVKDCIALYQSELDFDERTARGQVLAQEQMEGYFTCYYYGLKKISDLEAKYGADVKSFTNDLFSIGECSLATLERFLRLNPEQRARLASMFEAR